LLVTVAGLIAPLLPPSSSIRARDYAQTHGTAQSNIVRSDADERLQDRSTRVGQTAFEAGTPGAQRDACHRELRPMQAIARTQRTVGFGNFD
jgi:hypothetical protein